MSAPAPADPNAINVGVVIARAAERFKLSVLKCLPLMMVATLAGQAAEIYWTAAGHKPADLFAEHDAVYYVMAFAGTLIYLVLAAATAIRMQWHCAGQPRALAVDLQAGLAVGPRWLLAWLAATVLLALLLSPWLAVVLWARALPSGGFIVALATVLLAPLIYLSVCLSVLLPVVLTESPAPLLALRRSLVLVRPHWLRVLTVVIIASFMLVIFLLVGGIALSVIANGIASGNPAAATAVSTTISLLLSALMQIYYIALSFELYSAARASA